MIPDDYADTRRARLTAEQRFYLLALAEAPTPQRTWQTIRGWFVVAIGAAILVWVALEQF